MATKPNHDAALHFAIGALKPGEVAPGSHDLSRVQLTLLFPDFAAVSRAEGTAGGGYDLPKQELPALTLTLDAVLLFLERSRIGGPGAGALWLEAIRASQAGAKAQPPVDALAALEIVASELPPCEPAKRKTPAKRVGAGEVSVEVRRLPKAKS